ncbi:hypothetical protein [uncultured Tenacibaculum sp.]|uniref:hypothetical protein n=1 Tax=uncultured Tenacibaculum sp. TaxID=174713 RepID=UPI002611E9C4|nr:hypothetical protein [uncultured Tenacibaculum sp.]
MKGKNQNTQKDIIVNILVNANTFVTKCNNFLNNMLDYSIESLQIVEEEILEKVSKNLQNYDEIMQSFIINQTGSYIFEVARRNFGGKYYWYDPLNQPMLITGQPIFEVSMVAFEKVKQRIENGSKHNIPFFFKGYTHSVRTAKQGDQIMIY